MTALLEAPVTDDVPPKRPTRHPLFKNTGEPREDQARTAQELTDWYRWQMAPRSALADRYKAPPTRAPLNHGRALSLTPTGLLPDFAPVGKRAVANAHRISVYHLAAILYRAHTEGWRTTPGPHETYGRPAESPKTNMASTAARWVRFDSYLVRHGQAMQAQATISEREYKQALGRLSAEEVELIQLYYLRKPEAAWELEPLDTPLVPDLQRSRYATTFQAFEHLLAVLL